MRIDQALVATSRDKHRTVLRELYAAAEIAEYGLVNPLAEPAVLDILRLTLAEGIQVGGDASRDQDRG